MDPLSITAAVVTITTRCIPTAFQIHNAWGQYREAPQSIADLVDELQVVRASLLQLENFLKHRGLSVVPELKAVFVIAVEGCEATVLCLEKEFRSVQGQCDWRARIKILWEEDTMTRLLNQLARKKTSILLLMQCLNLESNFDVYRMLQCHQPELQRVSDDNASLVESYSGLSVPLKHSLHRAASVISIASSRNTMVSTTEFAFDSELLNTGVYMGTGTKQAEMEGPKAGLSDDGSFVISKSINKGTQSTADSTSLLFNASNLNIRRNNAVIGTVEEKPVHVLGPRNKSNWRSSTSSLDVHIDINDYTGSADDPDHNIGLNFPLNNLTKASHKNRAPRQTTQTTSNICKPLYTRRSSPSSKPCGKVENTLEASYSMETNVSSVLFVEDLQNSRQFMPMPSATSPMPLDSIFEGSPAILSPASTQRQSRRLDKEEVTKSIAQDTLKVPIRQRSQSLSKDEMTQRVMEKLQQKPTKTNPSRVNVTVSSDEELTPNWKSRHQKSKNSRDKKSSGIGISGTSSINNPRVLLAVDDAIRRLILPELNALKEEQRTPKSRAASVTSAKIAEERKNVAQNRHEAIVKLLLETGKANINSKDQLGQTPLSSAARHGHEAVVKLLLETGEVNVNSKDRSGRTPLLRAAQNGHEAVVKLLLETGEVNIDLKDQVRQTPLLWAAQNGHEAVIKLLQLYSGYS